MFSVLELTEDCNSSVKFGGAGLADSEVCSTLDHEVMNLSRACCWLVSYPLDETVKLYDLCHTGVCT